MSPFPASSSVASDNPEARIIRKGFGNRGEVGQVVAEDFKSRLIDWLRAHDFRLDLGRVRVELAREFGFCYGVDRAIDYAYETRQEFPDKRIFLTTEIIHNPRVNKRLIDMGIRFLSGPYADGSTLADVTPEDVVIVPAFGVSTTEMDGLLERGCVIVDTTCGSVMNVWKKVDRYAREGFTSVIHGKHYHEETIATASRATSRGGHYLVVLNKTEAQRACDYIRHGGDRDAFLSAFAKSVSPGFDPDQHLQRVGVANQTTMLSSESLEISRMFGDAMRDRWGAENIGQHFAAFDTICPATQERQDAMLAMLGRETPPDLSIVIGGFNSSNTGHLVEIANRRSVAYHVEDADALRPDSILHKPFGQKPVEKFGWLEEFAGRAPLSIGFTGGASTPNRVIGDTIYKTLELFGIPAEKVNTAIASS